MILLRSIELGGRCDFRNYPASETPLHLFLELFCRGFLLGVVKQDNRPVRCADVETLTIKSGGVMDLPEEVEKFLVGDACWVILDVRDLHVPVNPCKRLRMSDSRESHQCNRRMPRPC